MPEFYRNAWYAQLKKKVDELQEEIEKAIELPSVTSADEGKVLTVDVHGKWVAEEVPDELPVVQTTDEGKVLTVDENGAWSAETPSGGGISYSTTEQVIGTWVDGTTPVYQVVHHIHDSFSSSNTREFTVPGVVIDWSGYVIEPGAGIFTYIQYSDSTTRLLVNCSCYSSESTSTVHVKYQLSSTKTVDAVIILRYVKKTLDEMKLNS